MPTRSSRRSRTGPSRSCSSLERANGADLSTDHHQGLDDASSVASGVASAVSSKAAEEGAAYAHGENRPLGSFLVLIGAYGVFVALLSVLVRASGKRLPDRWPGPT